MNYINLFENFNQDLNQTLTSQEKILYMRNNFYSGYDEIIKKLETFQKLTRWAFHDNHQTSSRINGFFIKLGYAYHPKDVVDNKKGYFAPSLLSNAVSDMVCNPDKSGHIDAFAVAGDRLVHRPSPVRFYKKDIDADFEKLFGKSNRPVYHLDGSFRLDNEICESLDKSGFEKWITNIVEQKCFPEYFCEQITFGYRQSAINQLIPSEYPTSKDADKRNFFDLKIIVYDEVK